MVNVVLIMSLENVENSISKHLNCNIFWGVEKFPAPPPLREVGCRLLSQWGHLLQNLLTALIEDITWLHRDTKFLSECSKIFLSSS